MRFDGKTVILRDPQEVKGLLTGIEVNKYGEEIAPAGHDERRHIIDLNAVTKRVPMVMDKHYGELVEE